MRAKSRPSRVGPIYGRATSDVAQACTATSDRTGTSTGQIRVVLLRALIGRPQNNNVGLKYICLQFPLDDY